MQGAGYGVRGWWKMRGRWKMRGQWKMRVSGKCGVRGKCGVYKITHLTVVNENYFAECKNFSAILRHLCMNMAVNFKLLSFNSKRKEFIILIHLDRPRYHPNA